SSLFCKSVHQKERTAPYERERFGIKSSCINGSFCYGLCLSCFGKMCRKRVRALPMMRQKESKNEGQR
ncbi:hypothetical protein, partial [Bacillus pumilus]|uniref:hypothetical protein n=1 Tax=Bacillus pumilus TaxID=1408 RepID=UPI001C92E760